METVNCPNCKKECDVSWHCPGDGFEFENECEHCGICFEVSIDVIHYYSAGKILEDTPEECGDCGEVEECICDLERCAGCDGKLDCCCCEERS